MRQVYLQTTFYEYVKVSVLQLNFVSFKKKCMQQIYFTAYFKLY